MKVSVAHARGNLGAWFQLDLPEPVTAGEALLASPLLGRFPDLDPTVHRVGIFGKLCTPDTPLKEGDRVEIYLPVSRVASPEDEDDDE
ncbi:RnfH family protein [Pseudaeromonas sp. ZJS20]|uniref:RnfH family protein n=1 Tax=Pseudaeromonas aegiceratis TaxID=3153928 RepID=UPI00390C7FF5